MIAHGITKLIQVVEINGETCRTPNVEETWEV